MTWDDRVLRVDVSGVEKVTHWEYRQIRDRIVTARKAGPCALCSQQIIPGTRIRALTDWMEGEIETRRFCNACCEAMARDDEDHGEALTARYAMSLEPSP